ncbi:hypothetical protein ACIRF8_15725 [Streptomyces sp. NPDC102406]|uniref:hypothetical protein n=1 Tax=Streptomyces sp. NPDC102406 TaxID=3366171 RepID=UPI00380DD5EE
MNEQAGRYRVTLTLDGRPTMDGWWNLYATAAEKFTAWVGEQGRNGARVELVDTETGDVLKAWP